MMTINRLISWLYKLLYKKLCAAGTGGNSVDTTGGFAVGGWLIFIQIKKRGEKAAIFCYTELSWNHFFELFIDFIIITEPIVKKHYCVVGKFAWRAPFAELDSVPPIPAIATDLVHYPYIIRLKSPKVFKRFTF
jgi:hypothetical protein